MDLHRFLKGVQTRWASYENPSAGAGQGAAANRGWKGHAFDTIAPGRSQVLLDLAGSGVVRRVWMTVDDRSPEALQSLRLEMFWDGAAQPAVSAPLGALSLRWTGAHGGV